MNDERKWYDSLKKTVEISDSQLDKCYYYGGFAKALLGIPIIVIIFVSLINGYPIEIGIFYAILTDLIVLILFYGIHRWLKNKKHK